MTLAINAQDAQKILDRGVRYVLDTIDIEMEGMNGLELAGLMRKRLPDLKIVLLTAYTHYKHDLSSWAADAYIVKSPDFSELKALIRELI